MNLITRPPAWHRSSCSFHSTKSLNHDTGTVRIRVSKALLSFASPYFNTLLGRNFNEGIAAANGSDVKITEDR